jgi:hypothetical protein
MALIVENGSGLENAESYASVAFADAYFSARAKGDAWDAVDDKEAMLRLATEHMLQRYRLRWAGARRYQTQALDWPRINVPMKDLDDGEFETYYPNDSVPPEVQKACCELAIRAASASLMEDLGREVLSESVAGAVSVTYAQGSGRQVKHAAVDAMLSPYLTSSGLAQRS